MAKSWINGISNERCGACGHEAGMHPEPAPYRTCYASNDCRCMAFVSSGVFDCEAVIMGDYRSPNGANQNKPCTAPARIRLTWEDQNGRHTFDVCGRHDRTFRAYLTREELPQKKDQFAPTG